MNPVTELTALAFREGGAVERLKGSLRDVQTEFALHVAQSLDFPVRADERPTIDTAQVDPGVGKTLAYLIPHIISIIYHGDNRLVVATHTIDQREQVKEELSAESPNGVIAIVESTLLEAGKSELIPRLKALRVEERISMRSFASPTTAWKLSQENKHAIFKLYADWVEREWRGGRYPEVSKWLEHEYTGHLAIGPLGADGWKEWKRVIGTDNDRLDLTLLHEEIGGLKSGLFEKAYTILHEDDGPVSRLIEQQKTVTGLLTSEGAAHVVLTTHAMLQINSATYGRGGLRTSIMGNKTKKDPEPANLDHDAINVVIDECDAMSNTALQWNNYSIDLTAVSKFVESRTLNDHKTIRTEIKAALKKTLHAIAVSIEVGRGGMADQKSITAAKKAVPKGFEALLLRAESKGSLVKDDLVLASLVIAAQDLLDSLMVFDEKQCAALTLRDQYDIGRWVDALTMIINLDRQQGRATAEALIADSTDVMIYAGDEKGRAVIRTRASNTSALTGAPWRHYRTHAFRRFTLCSGTVVPRGVLNNETIKPFYAQIGIIPQAVRAGQSQQLDRAQFKHFPCRDHGSISKFVIARHSLMPVNRPEYASYIGEAIQAMEEDRKQTLVLFPSDELKRMVFDCLSPDIQSRVLLKPVGEKSRSFIDHFRDGGYTYWFGHDWAGVNFVRDGETLMKRIVVAQIPFGTIDEITETSSYAHSNRRMGAERNIRQGLGRGIRHSQDTPEFWSLDPRLEFIDLLVQRGLIHRRDPRVVTTDFFKRSDECIPDHLITQNTKVEIYSRKKSENQKAA
jgi:stress-induced morphogen